MATIIRNPGFILDAKTNSNGQPWKDTPITTSKRNDLLNNYWGQGGKRNLVVKTDIEIQELLAKSVDAGMIMVKVENTKNPQKVLIKWLPCDITAATQDETDCEYYIIEDTFLTQQNASDVPAGILKDTSHDGFAATIGVNKKGNYYLIINAVRFEYINSGFFGGEPPGVGTKVPDDGL